MIALSIERPIKNPAPNWPASLEEWLQNPPELSEWVDEQLVEKNGMSLKHGKVQAKLSTYWRNYKDTNGIGGEVYTDVPCRTNQRGRKPDVAYLTPALCQEYGDASSLPQSFPLCGEIISPTDYAEDVISKAQEYLESGSEEVWLVFPESKWIIVVTQNAQLIFTRGQTVSTQIMLPGLSLAVDDLVS